MLLLPILFPPLLLTGCGPGPDSEANTAIPASACPIDPPAAGALRTDGTRILDAHDRVVSLRGVNTGGRSKFAPYLPFDFDPEAPGDFEAALAEYLDRADTWGLTTLRVPFNWAALEPVEGQDDAAWLARYTALVDGAWERDLWVIVDFHQDVYGEFYCGDGFPAWTVEDPGPPHHDCADWFTGYLSDDEVAAAFDAFWSDETGVQTKYLAMWERMAGTFAAHEGVIGYEVFNEPGWGTASRGTWAATTLTDFYGVAAARVQAVDPDALVLFDATGIDAVVAATDLGRPVGDNLVFAPHFYDPAVIAGAGSVSVDVGEKLADWDAVGDGWDLPVLLGEYGVDPDLPEAESYMDDHYTAFDALGMHATWWQYSQSTEAWNFENLDLVDGDGVERAVLVDILARPVARAVAGEALTTSLADGVYRLDYTGTAGGVTEITLPPRASDRWPGAAAVSVSGTNFCFDLRADRVYVETRADGPVSVLVGR